jgi:hypothetical protein
MSRVEGLGKFPSQQDAKPATYPSDFLHSLALDDLGDIFLAFMSLILEPFAPIFTQINP